MTWKHSRRWPERARANTSAAADTRAAAILASLALPRAAATYWTTVSRQVARQLELWQAAAREIPQPELRQAALCKLAGERFNVEAAATFALVVPSRHRRFALDAIVALQVAYDYLDRASELGLTREPSRQAPIREHGDAGPTGKRSEPKLSAKVAPCPAKAESPSLEALADAVSLSQPPRLQDPYLDALTGTCRRSLSLLPAAGAVAAQARDAAIRCARAQELVHAAARNPSAEATQKPGETTLIQAGRELSDTTGLDFPEAVAGASASVLCIHALIAAAADPATTPAIASQLDSLYMKVGALTMLDNLLDRAQDQQEAQLDYLEHFSTPREMARRLASVALAAAEEASLLPHRCHHLLTIAGVIAYYSTAPKAGDPPGSIVFPRLRGALRPLPEPAVALMRIWRTAKRLSGVWSRHSARPPASGQPAAPA